MSAPAFERVLAKPVKRLLDVITGTLSSKVVLAVDVACDLEDESQWCDYILYTSG